MRTFNDWLNAEIRNTNENASEINPNNAGTKMEFPLKELIFKYQKKREVHQSVDSPC
jgi:hypothetical protein